ncbi:MAG TPA: hypothetical protein VHD84_00325 [Candidatus Saccharimonadales bacterium]|nr:hypothetical protein [Candidatus Saccharimonadales bacterium]
MERDRKTPFWERSANFFEKLHYGIGAVALAGYAVFQKEILATVGVIEIAHGLVINGIKNWFKNRKNKNSLQPAAA